MTLNAAEIKADLLATGAKENKHHFHLHHEKMGNWHDLTLEQQKDLDDFVTTNELSARDAVYTKQGIGMGLGLKDAYEYALDKGFPKHPLFIKNMRGGKQLTRKAPHRKKEKRIKNKSPK